jgi:hypothetical protein
MAYRITPTTEYVRFSPAPLSGYSVGPITMACFFKRTAVGVVETLLALGDSGLTTWRGNLYLNASNALRFTRALNLSEANTVLAPSSSVWYIAASTWAGTGTKPRLHIYDGSAWTHADGNNTLTGSGTVAGTDILTASVTYGGTDTFGGDIVCAGIKKTDRTDGQIETLTNTSFDSWRAFGFDWLIGFDTSLQAAGVLQDQASPGTGDETSKVGTSVVADPAGWNWVGSGAAPFVPKIVIT